MHRGFEDTPVPKHPSRVVTLRDPYTSRRRLYLYCMMFVCRTRNPMMHSTAAGKTVEDQPRQEVHADEVEGNDTIPKRRAWKPYLSRT